MTNQINYYNQFGNKFRDEILNAQDPSTWTSSEEFFGPIKKRVEKQKKYILKYFTKDKLILDIGCGFGRQSLFLVKNNFKVIGIDSCSVFIKLAQEIFLKHNLKGEFICTSIENFKPKIKFSQLLLLDVYEHIKPSDRAKFLKCLAFNICQKNAKILVTFPASERCNLRGKIMNILSLIFYKYLLDKEEHPYYIPSKKIFEGQFKKYFSIVNYELDKDININFWLLKLK